jgi:glycosyltransferase involved in cell wall biosynthesis
MVSAIIPVFNNEDTVKRAILSALNCERIVEVLVVDDGSTDSSLQVIEGLAKNFEKVKILYHSTFGNKGACACRNLGLKHAQGRWIQFLDADDELLPMKIESQVVHLNETIPFIVGNALDVFNNGRIHCRTSNLNPWIGLISGKLGITSANLWNKNYLNSVGGWDETLSSSQEYDLMFRIMQQNPNVKYSNGYLTKIYKSNDSISTSEKRKEERIRNWLNLRRRIKLYLSQNGLFSMRMKYHYFGSIFLFSKENRFNLMNDEINFLSKIYFFYYTLKSKIYQFVYPN